MRKPSILVVDDDDSTRSYVCTLLVSSGHSVVAAESGEEALSRLAAGATPAVVLLDLVMPGMNGLEVLERLKEAYPGLPVVILSTEGQIKTVVEAMRRGASDYLTKPFQEPELELALENVIEKQGLKEEVRTLRRRLDEGGDGDFITASPRMLKIKEIGRHVADTDAPVLILGESGAGKEVVARFIHVQSGRREKAFIKVNCAAIPQELLESELFGYERGAFSGALREKPGKFELADKGSILLDEIGEMTPHLQAKLLHVLQDGEYSRLGARQNLRADARVLASTNSRLDESVAAGRFREDLFFRLNVIRIEIPPLRERTEDIPLLVDHFAKLYIERYKSPLEELPRPLLDAFVRYDWPGNVRELENAVRRYLILPDLDSALAELKRERGRARPAAELPDESHPRLSVPEAPSELPLKAVAARAADEAERELAERVLAETRWNRKEAARRLKVSYKALLNKLKKWELEERRRPSGAGAAGGAKGGRRAD